MKRVVSCLVALAFVLGGFFSIESADARHKRRAVSNANQHYVFTKKKKYAQRRKARKSYAARQRARRANVAPVVKVNVDISSQVMTVSVAGVPYASWKVSSGRSGFETPRGSYRVGRMARTYFSRKYDNAPMPNAMFFHHGYAIHGTYAVKALGRKASHGCIRLAPGNAAALFNLVSRHGGSRTRVTITN